MSRLLKIPFLGANDKSGTLVEWRVSAGDFVQKGQSVGSVETTKVVMDIEADSTGFIYPVCAVGDQLETGQAVGLMSDTELADPHAEFDVLIEAACAQKDPESEKFKITKKAEILLRKHNLVFQDVMKDLSATCLDEESVKNYLTAQTQGVPAKVGVRGACERVGIIGCGGPANLIIDSLLRTPDRLPVAIFDRDDALHGKQQMGIKVVGNRDLIRLMFDRDEIDSVVIAFNTNLEERKREFEWLVSEGVPLANVIDPSVEIRSGVKMGMGNVILGRGYIGTLTSLGDNNFISANVCIEHENTLGSHCGFGPGVMSSGHVVMGDCIRFGIGVLMEPFVSVGSNSIIASGCVLRTGVAPNSVVKKTEDHKVRLR